MKLTTSLSAECFTLYLLIVSEIKTCFAIYKKQLSFTSSLLFQFCSRMLQQPNPVSEKQILSSTSTQRNCDQWKEQLTPLCRIEKLIVGQQGKKLQAIYRTWSCITMFTGAHHSFLILFSHVRPDQRFPKCGAPTAGSELFVWGTSFFGTKYGRKIKYVFWQAFCLAEIFYL
jgi:hypothetical protein